MFSRFVLPFFRFPCLYCLKCHIIITHETPLFKKIVPWYLLFTLFVLWHASHNTTSQNIWGTDEWAVHPAQFVLGDRPPLGHRPCIDIGLFLSVLMLICSTTCNAPLPPHWKHETSAMLTQQRKDPSLNTVSRFNFLVFDTGKVLQSLEK